MEDGRKSRVRFFHSVCCFSLAVSHVLERILKVTSGEKSARKHNLSESAATDCAKNIRYQETHGENPSDGQMAKMIQISREVEHKEYGYRSYSRDSAETEFLRCREGDLLFKHGLAYDASRALDHSRNQVQKSFEHIERQMEKEREHSNQKEMSM